MTNTNARFTPGLFGHAEKLLAELLRFAYPADATVSRYFKEHRQLGHADRAFIAESVFAVLRHWRSLQFRCRSDSPRALLLMGLTSVRGWSLRQLAPVLTAQESEAISAGKAITPDEMTSAVRCDLPDWLYQLLAEQYGQVQTEELARALNQAAPLDLRVNSIKAGRAEVQAKLAAVGIVSHEGTISPVALRLRDKPALARTALFQDGAFEVQDEGSQILGYLLAPRRGEMVVDFCAGAGGKTLLLGALMRNAGRLYAFDVSEKRLAKLKPRLARSGLSNVHPARIDSERDQKIRRLAGKIDKVLVDAPCSGLGTLRRNPDLKWRQTPEAIDELVAKQMSILSAASELVKPGGRLVYATCSLLAAENEQLVENFLARHPQFVPLNACEALQRQEIGLPGEWLRLLPHRHNTDGFFAALMERRQ